MIGARSRRHATSQRQHCVLMAFPFQFFSIIAQSQFHRYHTRPVNTRRRCISIASPHACAFHFVNTYDSFPNSNIFHFESNLTRSLGNTLHGQYDHFVSSFFFVACYFFSKTSREYFTWKFCCMYVSCLHIRPIFLRAQLHQYHPMSVPIPIPREIRIRILWPQTVVKPDRLKRNENSRTWRGWASEKPTNRVRNDTINMPDQQDKT